MTQTSPPLPVRFSVPIQLEGYEVTNDALKPGESLAVFLYWRALEKIEKDYVVFVHLLDRNGNQIAGYDSQPRNGKYSTSTWVPNGLIVDHIVMPIAKETPKGKGYQIAVGLYTLPGMERQPVIGQDGKNPTNQIIIEPFQILE